MESDKNDKQNPSQLNRESTILLIWGESDRNRPGGQKNLVIKKKSINFVEISTLSSDGSSGCLTYNRSQVRPLQGVQKIRES